MFWQEFLRKQNMKSIYTEITESKNKMKVPCAKGVFFHSRYDPEKEAQSYSSQFNENQLFFVIAGLAGGYHINSLLQVNSNRKIIVVEKSEEDFNFLRQIELVMEIEKSPNIIFSTEENLETAILNNYIPAVFGSLTFSTLRPWKDCFEQEYKKTAETVQSALKKISVDYLTQQKFGKIWTKNIFENLKYVSKSFSQNFLSDILKKYKKAAVIAAGPTLDESVKNLSSGEYFIISTDTAFSTLIKNGIIPHVCVSLDGQIFSAAHFIEADKTQGKTVFAFDITGNSSAVKHIFNLKLPFFFFETGHPLVKLASLSNSRNLPSFLSLNAGGGTVTASAVSLSLKAGFLRENIYLFGGDFSYPNGKPYCKGTYLDSLFLSGQTRTETQEFSFLKIMFSSSLVKTLCTFGNKKLETFTTEKLESYKRSVEAILETETMEMSEIFPFDFKNFMAFLKKSLENLKKNYTDNLTNPYFYVLLPLMAFLQNDKTLKKSFEGPHLIQKSYELARKITLEYT